VPGGAAAGAEADGSPADGGADGGGTSLDEEAVGAGGAAGEAGGTVGVSEAAGGKLAGGTLAGGTVAAIGEVAGGEEALAALRGETGGGFQSDGVASMGRFGSRDSASSIILGGHAGIAGSVGGSGGQMSLWVGSSASA
jgi:hypothetical protein